jgi:hypothetical protein
MTTTNLPAQQIEDSAAGTKLFFNNYGEEPLEFNATDVDASVTFFTTRGFDQDAATVVATTILRQAKLDGTPIYKILDSLSGFEGLAISTLVGEILNNNRTPTSTLGFRTAPIKPNQTRNIAA